MFIIYGLGISDDYLIVDELDTLLYCHFPYVNFRLVRWVWTFCFCLLSGDVKFIFNENACTRVLFSVGDENVCDEVTVSVGDGECVTCMMYK